MSRSAAPVTKSHPQVTRQPQQILRLPHKMNYEVWLYWIVTVLKCYLTELLLGGGLNSRHLPKTHATIAGHAEKPNLTPSPKLTPPRANHIVQQKKSWNRVFVLQASPNLNKNQPHSVVKHKENPIRLSCNQQQITLCTAHSAHPLTSPSLSQTMRTLCRTQRQFIPTLTPLTANHTVHNSFITAWKI